MWHYNYSQQLSDDELYHHGVLGMKWGVRRAIYKHNSIGRLQSKALKFDKKSANAEKKSEKVHAKIDLGRANRAAVKSAKLEKKAANLKRKALKTDNDLKKSFMEKRAYRLEYRSAKKKIKGDRLSKTTGYGPKALKYAIKSDKFAKKAAHARMVLASNKAYIEKMKVKISELSETDRNNGYEFVNQLNDF